jgi:two-component sensor histidine kinase
MPPKDEDPALLPLVQMQELRHRLRNHLQNMISLISLQIRRARQQETIAALEDLRARFATLTSIYIDLDESSDTPLQLGQFVPDLVRRVGELYDPTRKHQVMTAIEPCALPGTRAAILGQITVELVMNIYRHAFASRDAGRINVTLAVFAGLAELKIVDDGPGLRVPDSGRTHLGFTIIRSLAAALSGTFDHESGNGFTARVRFPVDQPEH